jgi:hypothetical protein
VAALKERFEIRVPRSEQEHYAAWVAAAEAAGVSLRDWVIRACNAAVAPPDAPADRPPAVRVVRSPAPAPGPRRDAWWEAGLWAGRIERAMEEARPEAISWVALRRWTQREPVAGARLLAWLAGRPWGERWIAAWRSPAPPA